MNSVLLQFVRRGLYFVVCRTSIVLVFFFSKKWKWILKYLYCWWKLRWWRGRGPWARGEGEEEWGLQTSPLSGAWTEPPRIFVSISIAAPPPSLSTPFLSSLSYCFLFFHPSEMCRCQGRGPEQEGRSSKSEIKKTLQIKDKKDPEIQMSTANILKYAFLCNCRPLW